MTILPLLALLTSPSYSIHAPPVPVFLCTGLRDRALPTRRRRAQASSARQPQEHRHGRALPSRRRSARVSSAPIAACTPPRATVHASSASHQARERADQLCPAAGECNRGDLLGEELDRERRGAGCSGAVNVFLDDKW
jgi:hypothetical protein